MSVGGAYAAACAATHPGRVRALGVVATLPPPADDPAESVEEMMRGFAPGFAEYVAGLAPQDPDDLALVDRFTAGLPPADAQLLRASVPTGDVAASVREALAVPEGYLRDAALTFRPWAFDLGAIRCPTTLRYGSADERAMPGGPWLAERVRHAELVVVPGATHLATLLGSWPALIGSLLR
jgi:pimeloyl-ACP methyl ester carboxylesterase